MAELLHDWPWILASFVICIGSYIIGVRRQRRHEKRMAEIAAEMEVARKGRQTDAV